MTLDLADIREYVVPLFVADNPASLRPDQPVVVSRDSFLGTAFFVAKNGVALTAAHCVPDPSTIPAGQAFLAIVWDGTRDEVEPLAQDIVAWHQALAPAGDTTCVFRDSAFADDVAKTNLAAILSQHGLANVRSL